MRGCAVTLGRDRAQRGFGNGEGWLHGRGLGLISGAREPRWWQRSGVGVRFLGSCSSSLAPARSPPGEAAGEEQLEVLPGCKQTQGLQHHGYPGHAPAAAAPWGVNHGNKKTANRKKKNKRRKQSKW